MRNIDDKLLEIDTPSLIVDQDVLQKNIIDMRDFAKKFGVDLRPHVKIHKCPELAKRQMKSGAVGIAVAKVSEAEVMAKDGIKDIQIANEIVAPNKIMKLISLQNKCDLTIAVDNRKNVEMISELMKENKTSIDVLVDIDIGLHRCGLSHKNPGAIARFVKFLNSKPGINFKGIMTHAGQAYRCKNIKQVKEIGLFEGKKMVELANLIRKEVGVKCKTISVGSTPTAKFAGRVRGVTELRPGNYIFNDYIQVALGVASISNCALRILSSVISTPSRNRVIIDAGSKSLGLDKCAHGNKNIKGYGYIVNKRAVIRRLSEEHGFIGNIQRGKEFNLGERIQIVPNHACYVVNLHDKIIGTNGEEFVIKARGCSQ